MADTWPTKIVWVIMQQDQDGQKFQNIEESRAGVAYRRISEIQTIHNDVRQLQKLFFLVPSPRPHAGPSQSHTERWPLGY